MSKAVGTTFHNSDGNARLLRLGWLFRLNRLVWGEAVAVAMASDDEWLVVQHVYAARERHARIKARVMAGIAHMAQDGPPAEQGE
jgi:hypothetical protein